MLETKLIIWRDKTFLNASKHKL